MSGLNVVHSLLSVQSGRDMLAGLMSRPAAYRGVSTAPAYEKGARTAPSVQVDVPPREPTIE